MQFVVIRYLIHFTYIGLITFSEKKLLETTIGLFAPWLFIDVGAL